MNWYNRIKNDSCRKGVDDGKISRQKTVVLTWTVLEVAHSKG